MCRRARTASHVDIWALSLAPTRTHCSLTRALHVLERALPSAEAIHRYPTRACPPGSIQDATSPHTPLARSPPSPRPAGATVHAPLARPRPLALRLTQLYVPVRSAAAPAPERPLARPRVRGDLPARARRSPRRRSRWTEIQLIPELASELAGIQNVPRKHETPQQAPRAGAPQGPGAHVVPTGGHERTCVPARSLASRYSYGAASGKIGHARTHAGAARVQAPLWTKEKFSRLSVPVADYS